MSHIYTDEFIEHWGAHFVSNRIQEQLGITFEQFLAGFRYREAARQGHRARLAAIAELKRRAEHHAATTDRAAIADFEDLLPAQQRIAEREIEQLPRRNGAPVEKLAHHRYPKSVAHFGAHQETHR